MNAPFGWDVALKYTLCKEVVNGNEENRCTLFQNFGAYLINTYSFVRVEVSEGSVNILLSEVDAT